MLDSGSYDTGFFDFFGFIPTSYDYLRNVGDMLKDINIVLE